MKQRRVRVGFDLDGVLIGKPFFVPDKVMEKLVRQKTDHKLLYRFPQSSFERKIRYISHHPILRPPIRKNIGLIEELSKSTKYELFVVSGRYSFLEERTREWFKYYKLRKPFKKIYINSKNEQPHLFKERMIKKLKLDVFIDDDQPLLRYLQNKLKKVEFLHTDENKDRIYQK
jgi:hypothetical protein